MKLDKRRNYYLVLDCETATLPYAINFDGKARQTISIAKPLIYDLGWQVIDRQGRVYDRKNFLISEIFSVPSIFDTAYYASKKPKYLEMLRKGEIEITNWDTAIAYLEDAMASVESVGAYNSMFDFKKAIPFTEEYIRHLYSEDFYEWEKHQNSICDYIVENPPRDNKREFNPNAFLFRGIEYPLFDLWGLSCKHIINTDEYKQMCIDNEWATASGKYFKTSAETTYRYINKDNEFIESHTALDDATIESEIFARIVKKKISNLEIGIIYFPFRILGTIDEFIG